MIITKKDLIYKVSRESGLMRSLVRQLYNILEDEVFNALSAHPEEDIEVRLFEGISLIREIKPSKRNRHPLSGEITIIPEKKYVKAKITRCYNQKVRERTKKTK